MVSAPHHITAKALDRVIHSKKQWLKKKIKEPVRQVKTDRVQYLSHDAVWFNGKLRKLVVFPTNGHPKVSIVSNGSSIDDSRIYVYLKPNGQAASFEKLITTWLRKELKLQINDLVEKWEPVLGVSVNECRIKRMKTRWGSCNISAGRIWLNMVLIHLPPSFLEYVVVHEMVHLLERHHNERFKEYMNQFIPQWRVLKKEMDQFSI